jgi:hypothetical protein
MSFVWGFGGARTHRQANPSLNISSPPGRAPPLFVAMAAYETTRRVYRHAVAYEQGGL